MKVGQTMAKVTSYQDKAYEEIKKLVMTAQLQPGQKISKNELVETLEIGDTPVREAIIRLHREGLLEVIPQSGTYVSKINLAEVYQARFVRENIEPTIFKEATELATTKQLQELEKKIKIQAIYFEDQDPQMYFNLDEEFHEYFYKMAGKEFVWEWLQLLNTALNRFRYLRLDVKELGWLNILTEHRQILEYVTKKDSEALNEIILKHIHTVDDDIKIVMKEFPDYFV